MPVTEAMVASARPRICGAMGWCAVSRGGECEGNECSFLMDYIARRVVEALMPVFFEGLRPIEAVKGSKALVVYFGSDADRDEFIGAMQDARPNMRAVEIK